ncbi:hypothetical protein ACFQY0_10420 [Haloferula chungangensis]|uniref:Ig-like domain-containing protein n=1 Tax=Haloferula chungangensis TaxID=1048331 RepID=A0ABW2L814_9BACT
MTKKPLSRLLILCLILAELVVPAFASLEFTFNQASDVAITAPSYTASGALDLTLNFQPTPGQNLTVVKNTGVPFLSGTFDGVPQGATVPLTFNGTTYHYIANYFGGNGRSLVLQWPDLQMVGWAWDNSLDETSTPSQLTHEGELAGKSILSVAPGGDYTLALTADGEVFAWGRNTYGQLGNGTTESSDVPVQVEASGALAGKTVVAIAASSVHSLALTSDGKVFAWGDNGSGRLGDGTTEGSRTPVAVDTSGALAGKSVVAIAAGQYHSLALTSDGLVFAWGYGFQGQLGNGLIDNHHSPVPVDTSGVLAGKTVTGISAGFTHSAAVTSEGKVITWGFNSTGQLGNNSTSPSPVPVQVVATGSLAGKSVSAISAGANFNLALTSDGQVHAWGSNGSGQLGIGSSASSLVPALAGGSLSSKSVISIAAGDAHSTALTSDGQPHVWGSDGYAQLGNGADQQGSALSPVPVPGLGPSSGRWIAAFFSGRNRCYALADPGPPQMRVHPLNLAANPGAAATFSAAVAHPFPTTVQWQISTTGAGGPFVDITDEASANTRALSLSDTTGIADGSAFRAVFSSLSGSATSHPATFHEASWPASFSASAGPLATVSSASVSGNLSPILSFEPTPGTDLTVIWNTGPAPIHGRFSDIPQGATVPLTFNGITYHYIANYYGGNGRSLVLQWPAMGLVGWGSNGSGVLGDIGTSSQNPPVEIPLAGPMVGKTVSDISMSGGHALALTSDGMVFAWGNNGNGQLGNNSTTGSHLPVAVDTSGALNGKTVVAIAAGARHSLAITAEGRVLIWGKLRSSISGTDHSLTPTELSPDGALHDKIVVAVSAGGDFDLALTSEGEIYGWGAGDSYQLGTNGQYHADPVRIDPGEIGTTPVVAIAAGNRHGAALTQDGVVFSWGSASEGALGNGGGPPSFGSPLPTPVDTSGVLADKFITAIAATDSRSMAVSSEGEVFGWGRNWAGELGNGTTTLSWVPVAVDTNGVLAGKAVASLSLSDSHTMALTTTGELFAWGDNGSRELGDGGWTDSSVPVAVDTTGIMANLRFTRVVAGWNSSVALAGRGAPTVIRQPLDLMVAAGQSATFTAAAEDPFPFTVRWQVSPTGMAGTFGDLPDNSGTLTLPEVTADQDGWAYRAVFTNAAGERASTPALLRIVEWSATLSSASPAPFEAPRIHASGTLDLQLDFVPPAGTNLMLVENTGPSFIDGAFENIPQGGLINLTHHGVTYPFIANYHGGNGRSLVLHWPWTSVAAWGSSIANVPTYVATRPALAEKTITDLKSGRSHQLALTTEGKVFSWGSNNRGQLGNTLTTSNQVPGQVKDDGILAEKTVVTIATGEYHNLALSANGEVFSWGENSQGQLGKGSSLDYSAQPVAVIADGALAGKIVTAIAAGDNHSLALTADGLVFAWGDNGQDQLGTINWQDSLVPAAVDTRGALLGKSVVAIAAGDKHSLALTSDGEIIAWGENIAGQLGDGSTIDPRIPVKVDMTGALAGKRVVAIAAGEGHSLALTDDGLVFAWGENYHGQLGDNTAPTNSSVPVAVATDGALSGKFVTAISAGGDHCMAQTADGAIVSWGLNSSGQLGNDSRVNSPVPVSVVSTGILQSATVQSIVSVGIRSFALLGVAASPYVTVNPEDLSFILGDGADTTVATFDGDALDPLPISIQWQQADPDEEFTDITDNPSASTSKLQLGGLSESQDGHQYRAIFTNLGGTNATMPATLNIISAESPVTFQSPDQVPFTASSPTLAGTLDLSLGFAPVPGVELTVIRNTGSAFFSGSFSNLVQGATIPLNFDGISHSFTVDYFGGNGRSLVLRWTDTLPIAWGRGSYGQVGAGTNTTTNKTSVAVDTSGVMSGKSVVKVAAGADHSLALTSDGRVFAWGSNSSGKLGNGTSSSSSVPVEVDHSGELSGKRVIGIAAGSNHSLALTSDGHVAAWGSNFNYTLGNGGTASSATPVAVSRSGVLAGKTVTAISSGSVHNVALTSDGSLITWGSNQYGQLGTGSTMGSPTPVEISNSGDLAGRSVVSIAAGGNHTLVLTADGRIYSWGANQDGQLGGSSYSSSIPLPVSGDGLIDGKTVVAIAAGAAHSLAVTSDGRVYAWGDNRSDQLGTGSFFGSSIPTAVGTDGLLAGKTIVAVAAGDGHSLAISSDGLGYAWGSTRYGELGDNSSFRPMNSPVAISALGAHGNRPLIAIAAGGSHSLAIAGKGTAPTVAEQPGSLRVNAGDHATFTATADGYPAPTVRWQRSITGPGGAYADLAGQMTSTLELDNITANQNGYAYRAVFTNLEASTNSSDATLDVDANFASFLASRSLPPESQPMDDPFETGIPHILSYAFDLNPAAPTRSSLPFATPVAGRLQISYTRWKNAPDLQYTVEASTGLGTWISGPGNTEVVSVTSLDSARETVVEQEILNDPSPARFLRVRVEQVDP